MASEPSAIGPRVEEFGYRQEWERTVRRFASFAIGFAFISITTGIFTTYGFVIGTAGPLGIWTWPIVIVGQTFVSLCFAALASRMPLAGYSYQWMSRLANPSIGWGIGWLAFTFLAVDVVAVDYALASTVLPSLFGYAGGEYANWFATGIVIALQGVLIALSTVWATRVNNIGVGTEVGGIVGLIVLLLIVSAITGDQDWGNLFQKVAVERGTDYFGFGSATHVGPWILAFLLGSFTIVGFEAAANLAEETDQPERVVPFAMWSAVVLSGVVGFGFLIAITVAAGNFGELAQSATPVADVITDILGTVVGKIFLVIVMISIFVCGLVIYITAARVTWAMSRDERFPGWQLWRRSSARFRTPLLATLLCGVVIEVVLAAFAKRPDTLFKLFSAATLLPALIYLSTVVLFALVRRRLPRERGFSLGRLEGPVIVLALVWLLFEMSIFRDASFKDPWIYAAIMFGIGLVYFLWLRFTRSTLAMPGSAPPEGEYEARAKART